MKKHDIFIHANSVCHYIFIKDNYGLFFSYCALVTALCIKHETIKNHNLEELVNYYSQIIILMRQDKNYSKY